MTQIITDTEVLIAFTKKYIPDIVYSSPTYSKFIFFLKNKNTDILKNLTLYISEAYVLRDKILQTIS